MKNISEVVSEKAFNFNPVACDMLDYSTRQLTPVTSGAFGNRKLFTNGDVALYSYSMGDYSFIGKHLKSTLFHCHCDTFNFYKELESYLRWYRELGNTVAADAVENLMSVYSFIEFKI